MKHGSLFSGIGGFDLAAQWAGWENIFHCEWNPFGQKILHHYWPEAESFNDITKTDFTKYANEIDILTGGFPCQPYSSAGKRKGKEDERHLWPEMLRAIREIQPRWVVGENVRGLTNWNGGMVFDEVQTDLEAEGYEIIPFLLPACAVNAPHRRDRIWFIAYSNSYGSNQCNSQHEINASKGRRYAQRNTHQGNSNGNATDTKRIRLEHSKEAGNIREGKTKTQRQRGKFTKPFETNGNNGITTDTISTGFKTKGKQSFTATQNKRIEYSCSRWQRFPTQSPVCGGNDGLPAELDGITFSKWRAESIKGYGNAIVPQVAYQIFNAINQYEYNHR